MLFIVFSLIPMAFVGIISYGIASNTTSQMALEAGSAMIQRVCNDLDRLFLDAYNISVVIANDIDIQDILRKNFTSTAQLYSFDLRGDTRLNFISTYKKDIYGLYVIGKNGSKHKSKFSSFQDGDLRDTQWFNRILHSELPVWFGTHQGSFAVKTIGDRLISGGFPIVDKASGQKNGIVLFDIAESTIKNLLQKTTDSNMIVLDKDNRLITGSTDPIDDGYIREIVRSMDGTDRMAPAGEEAFAIETHEYLIVYKPSSITGWKLIGTIQKSDLQQRSIMIGLVIAIAFLMVCILSFFVSLQVSRSVAKPILKLQQVCKQVEEGDLTVRAQVETQDEIGMLAGSFNVMVDKLGKLMEQTVSEQKKLRKAELTALQAQINPHFLYNTLDSIIWLARKEDTATIIEVVCALTRLFRISLSKGKDIICIADEVEHVNNYLLIQKMRYKNKLSYECQVEPQLRNHLILKLVLQPIVENAIYHGIKLRREGGTVRIEGTCKDDLILFTISDTGIGLLPDRLDEVRQELHLNRPTGNADGYGLKNIDERMKIYYGEQYGISIDSQYMVGTTVTLCLPVRSEVQQ